MANTSNIPQHIDTLRPNGVEVLLMRRTSNGTVKTSVGCRWAGGEIRGWFGSRSPTHWVELPPFVFGHRRAQMKG